MRHKHLSFCLTTLILLATLGGCGSTTPSGLMMKGGSWLVKKAITKQVKEGFSKKDDHEDKGKKSHRRDREHTPREKKRS